MKPNLEQMNWTKKQKRMIMITTTNEDTMKEDQSQNQHRTDICQITKREGLMRQIHMLHIKEKKWKMNDYAVHSTSMKENMSLAKRLIENCKRRKKKKK